MDETLFLQQLESLLVGRWLTDLANFSAFFYHELPDLSWVGFYLLDDGDTLFLGPFQGKVACTEIKMGKGVCGTAALRKESVLVPDVHEFPGHIACDAGARSELVVPLRKEGKIIGVLDMDSYSPARFTEKEKRLAEQAVEILLRKN